MTIPYYNLKQAEKLARLGHRVAVICCNISSRTIMFDEALAAIDGADHQRINRRQAFQLFVENGIIDFISRPSHITGRRWDFGFCNPNPHLDSRQGSSPDFPLMLRDLPTRLNKQHRLSEFLTKQPEAA